MDLSEVAWRLAGGYHHERECDLCRTGAPCADARRINESARRLAGSGRIETTTLEDLIEELSNDDP